MSTEIIIRDDHPRACVRVVGSLTHVFNGSLRLMTYRTERNASWLVDVRYFPVDYSTTLDDLMAQARAAVWADEEWERDQRALERAR